MKHTIFFRKGYQTSRKYRTKRFNQISINGDYAYCESHKFIFNPEVEEKHLYHAEPCIYTDINYKPGFNSYKRAYIFFNRKKPISLKSCIRRMRKMKGLEKGTVVDFTTSWYYPNKNVDTSFIYKENNNKSFRPEYKINDSEFTNNFTTDLRSSELVIFLRENGCIVKVWNQNPGFIIGEEEGEIAMGWGYGKQFGFSSNNDTFRGYGNGRKNFLWDHFGSFDKWSKCEEIPKTELKEQILNILKTPESNG